MDRDEIQRRVNTEEDYIRLPKFSNSLSRFLSKNQKLNDDRAIARLLMIGYDEVTKIYNEAIDSIRKMLKK